MLNCAEAETGEGYPAFMRRMQQPLGTTEAGAVAPEDAFARFYEEHYGRLARAVYLLTRDPYEADDVAQEAMVRTLEKWDRVSRMDSPVGYLYRTALNLRRSRLRRLAVRTRRSFSRAVETDPAVGAAARDEISRALSALPATQREALVLVEWVGLGPEEAGRALGIEPVSVRVRLSRARAALREHLGGASDD